MSIYTRHDEVFEPFEHEDLGERIAIIKHSVGQAKTMIVLGVILIISAGFPLITGDALHALISVFLLFIGPMILILGLVQRSRSKGIVYLHDFGLCEERGGKVTTIEFLDVMDAKLIIQEIRGGLSMKLTISTNKNKIVITDYSTLVDQDNQSLMLELAQFVVNELPEEVQVNGFHAIERSLENKPQTSALVSRGSGYA